MLVGAILLLVGATVIFVGATLLLVGATGILVSAGIHRNTMGSRWVLPAPALAGVDDESTA